MNDILLLFYLFLENREKRIDKQFLLILSLAEAYKLDGEWENQTIPFDLSDGTTKGQTFYREEVPKLGLNKGK